MGSIIRSSFRPPIRTRGSRIGLLSRRSGLSLRGGTGGNPPTVCRRRSYAADVADFMEIRQANGYLRPERGARVITRAAQIVDHCRDNLGSAIAILRFDGERLAPKVVVGLGTHDCDSDFLWVDPTMNEQAGKTDRRAQKPLQRNWLSLLPRRLKPAGRIDASRLS